MAGRAERQRDEQPARVVVAYRDGQAERIEPDVEPTRRPGVRDGVPHQLARHEHGVVTNRLEPPIPGRLVYELARPARRRRILAQVEIPGDGRWTTQQHAVGQRPRPVRAARSPYRSARLSSAEGPDPDPLPHHPRRAIFRLVPVLIVIRETQRALARGTAVRLSPSQ